MVINLQVTLGAAFTFKINRYIRRLIDVVVTIHKTESILIKRQNMLGRILQIRPHAKPEKWLHTKHLSDFDKGIIIK